MKPLFDPGLKKKRQVSVVIGNRLERKGSLEFAESGIELWVSGCTVLNQRTIVLCFGGSLYETNVCRQSNNPLGSFTKMRNSKYRHFMTRIASFDGKNKSY